MLLAIVVLLILSQTRYSNCVCKESVLSVYCDNLEDVKNYRTETWTEIVIGDSKSSRLPSAALADEFFLYVPNLLSLTVINRLNNGWMDQSLPCLDYLNLGKNSFETLSLNLFAQFTDLRTLILRENKIKELASSYEGASLRILDLALNQFKRVEDGQFNKSSLKWISMKMGKVRELKTAPFPSSLKFLVLNYNNLEQINERSIHNLNHLEELYVAHNKLKEMMQVQLLTNIKVIDLSYNEISTVLDNFSELKNLKYLDLSHNKISRIHNPVQIINQYDFIRISIAFNNLTNLELNAITALISSSKSVNNQLSLYGNPFFCKCLDQFPRLFKDLRYSYCDLKFFKSGKTPVCIQNDAGNCPDTNTKPDEELVKEFLKAIDENKAIVGCNIGLEFYSERNSLIKKVKFYD